MSTIWPEVALGDITTSQYGLSIATSDEGTVPILGMRNLQDGRIVFCDLARVAITPGDTEAYQLHPGDILFNRTNSLDLVGKTSLVENATEEPVVFASYLVRFKVDTSRALPAFVNYFLNCPESERRLKDMATPGVSQYNINPTQLRKQFRIPLPSLGEQRAISSILGTWDRCLNRLDELIGAKIRFKQGLMQQLLTGTRRFKGFRDDWQLVQMKDVTEECLERNRGRLGVSRVMAVTKAEGIVPMRERTIAADIDRYSVVNKDCFAYNPMRLNIGSIARWGHEQDILVSPDYVVFRCKPEVAGHPTIDVDFLDQFRRSRFWERFVTSSGNGSVRIRIYFSDLGAMKIQLPSLPEQRKIAALLGLVDREIHALNQQRLATSNQKRGLMQKLLSGQVRIKGIAA